MGCLTVATILPAPTRSEARMGRGRVRGGRGEKDGRAMKEGGRVEGKGRRHMDEEQEVRRERLGERKHRY